MHSSPLVQDNRFAGQAALKVRACWLGALLALSSPAAAQSIWHSDGATSMFSDKRASRVGDLLTIIVQETTTTSKDNKTASSKKTSLDASIATFLYSPAASGFLTKGGQLPAIKYNSEHDFNGGGTINNSEQIVAQITVRVVDVMPNKTLLIEGTRETAFGGEKQTVILRGTVRSEDVAANNTVFSYNVSDAKIQFISKGSITDAQRKGWFTRIWEFFTPF
jgi:flagellar L-ring protein FlgH